jgi:hypothetical protein
MTARLDRRRFLAGAAGVVATLAGCTGADEDDDGTDPSPDGRNGTPTAGSSGTGGTATPDPTTAQSTAANDQGTATGGGGATMTETAEDENDDLDLREANVVDVGIDRQDGRVRFEVSLFHDDDGEDEYANWWQVETLDGKRLGRRELLHAHSTAPFTRSETIEIPDGTPCVVVRGHDQIHGYGGQAAIVNLDSGKTVFVRQGSEKRSFEASACP